MLGSVIGEIPIRHQIFAGQEHRDAFLRIGARVDHLSRS